jgi:hypothetical protein
MAIPFKSRADFPAIKIEGGTGDQGIMSWNTEDQTVDLIVSPDVTYQLGQELGHVVRNLSGQSISNGIIVMVTGASGNKITVDIADSSYPNISSATFAVVTETINNNSTGRVTTEGVVRGLDTSTLTEGSSVWLGANGSFTDLKPLTPNYLVHIGWVVRSHSSAGSILVKVQNGSNIEELHNVLIDNVQEGQGLVWDAANGYWKNSDLASGGGGSSTLTVEKNEYTGDGTTVAFTLSSAVQSESQTQVYIDGVYQSKANYTTSGSVITFSEAPDTGTDIEVIHLLSVSAVVYTDSFTGNGSTSEYTLSNAITAENNTQVYFDGVYQSKSNYTASGSVITFSENVPAGVAIEIVHLKAVDISALNSSLITGDGTTTDFTLPQSVDSKDKTFVFLQGVYQEKSTYTISGTTISFVTPPQNGYTVEVITFANISLFDPPNITSGDGISVTGTYPNVIISNTQTSPLKYAINVISVSTNALHGNLYLLTADLTLTLPSSPALGDSIKISNLSGVATCTLGANGNNIMATAGDLTLDDASKSFELIYTDTANGWVII